MPNAVENFLASLPAGAGPASGALLVVLLIWLAWSLRRRRLRSVEQKLRRAAIEVLRDFVIPDGAGGEIHIEWALLTPRGIVILDYKDVAGHVFGSDSMQDWTVIAEQRRFTFVNPQPALFDRMAAVKRLVPDAQVFGFVAFSSRAQFTKGEPSDVVILDRLVAELAAERGSKGAAQAEGMRTHWDRLRHEAVTAQFGQLLRT